MASLIKTTCHRRQRQTVLVLIASFVVVVICSDHAKVNAYRLNSVPVSEQEDVEDSKAPSSASASTSLKTLQSKLDLILDTESHEKKLLESLLFESEQNESKLTSVSASPSQSQTRPQPQPEQKSFESVVSNLLENSGRMESMIGMLGDFKSVLSQSISTAEKQLGYKTEVIQLREEVGYLREEIQKLKSQHASAEAEKTGLSSAYRNKIRNDEATMNWLKDSVKELRHEIVEVSSSLNVTGLLHLQQQVRLQEKSTSRDVQGLQRQIEGLQVNFDQVNEQLLEIQADVADVRTWQTKMGQRLVKEEGLNSNSIEMSHQKSKNRAVDWQHESETLSDRRVKLLQESLQAGAEIHKKNNKNAGRHSNSKKQLKLELHRVEKILLETVRDQDALAQKVKQLEMSSNSQQHEHERAVWKKVVQSGKENDDNDDDGLVTITYSEDNNDINDDLDSQSESETQRRIQRSATRRIRRGEVYNSNDRGGLGPLTNLQTRVSALEKSLAESANSLDVMDNKVDGLSELHATTKALFTSLETIENKYDLKITDLQSTMAKVEAGVSGLQVASDELKEQQHLQNQMQQSCKKETRALSQSTQTTQLRIASLQNQILKWGLKLCEATNKESIDGLKIVSLGAHSH